MLKINGLLVPRQFGWVPDPYDARDLDFKSSPYALLNETNEIDRAEYYKELSNQLSLPACVGNAAGDYWEAALIYALVKKGMGLAAAKAAVPNLSRMFIWWNARNEMDPNQTHNSGSGTHNRLAMDIIARFGVPDEKLWPYDPAKATIRPSIMSYRDAYQRRSEAFYKILSSGNERISSVIKALTGSPGVLFGTGVGREFFGYKTGILDTPSETEGRHAMVIVGWSGSKMAFKVRNSWGNWGESGYCWMTPSYIAWSGSRSFWVSTTT